MSPCQSAFLRVTESHVTAGGSPSGTGRGSSRSLRAGFSIYKEGETEAGSWVREQIGARNSHLWAPSRLSGGHPLKAYFTPGSYLLHDILGGGKEGGVPSSLPASATPALPQGSWTDRSRAHLLPRDQLGGRREAGQAGRWGSGLRVRAWRPLTEGNFHLRSPPVVSHICFFLISKQIYLCAL